MLEIIVIFFLIFGIDFIKLFISYCNVYYKMNRKIVSKNIKDKYNDL